MNGVATWTVAADGGIASVHGSKVVPGRDSGDRGGVEAEIDGAASRGVQEEAVVTGARAGRVGAPTRCRGSFATTLCIDTRARSTRTEIYLACTASVSKGTDALVEGGEVRTIGVSVTIVETGVGVITLVIRLVVESVLVVARAVGGRHRVIDGIGVDAVGLVAVLPVIVLIAHTGAGGDVGRPVFAGIGALPWVGAIDVRRVTGALIGIVDGVVIAPSGVAGRHRAETDTGVREIFEWCGFDGRSTEAAVAGVVEVGDDAIVRALADVATRSTCRQLGKCVTTVAHGQAGGAVHARVLASVHAVGFARAVAGLDPGHQLLFSGGGIICKTRAVACGYLGTGGYDGLGAATRGSVGKAAATRMTLVRRTVLVTAVACVGRGRHRANCSARSRQVRIGRLPVGSFGTGTRETGDS